MIRSFDGRLVLVAFGVSLGVFDARGARAAPWSQQKITVTGAPDEQFGTVAVSGNTAVVGAPFKSVTPSDALGAAYVYTTDGTKWSFQQQLDDPMGGFGDTFGSSVAIDGDTLVVGMPQTIGDGIGYAYVFTRSGTTWSSQPEWFGGSDGMPLANFGYNVAVSGDTAVVSAGFNRTYAEGVVYVFTRSGTTWTETKLLTAPDNSQAGPPPADGSFGISLAISGNTMVIGRKFETIGTTSSQGSAYIYVGSGSTWTLQKKLIAADGARDDIFGNSVGISGDTVIVGAPEANSGRGKVYVYVRSGTTWSLQKTLTASDGVSSDLFGIGVSASGNTALVGAYWRTGGTEQGAAYAYDRSGTTWTEQKLTASDGVAGDHFGLYVSVSGNNAAVGAPGKNSSQGAAYLFTRPAAGSGGAAGTGGAGGAAGSGGGSNSGGAQGSGGAAASGGSSSSGGAGNVTGGATGAGGTSGQGGSDASAPGSGASGPVATGGLTATGGAASMGPRGVDAGSNSDASAGNAGNARQAAASSSNDSSCHMASGRANSSFGVASLLAALALVRWTGRPRRSCAEWATGGL